MPRRLIAIGLLLIAAGSLAAAIPQRTAAADLAARMSGRWKLNADVQAVFDPQ